jgi:hypothetical protein
MQADSSVAISEPNGAERNSFMTLMIISGLWHSLSMSIAVQNLITEAAKPEIVKVPLNYRR